MAQELSLLGLFNKLAQQQTIYGEKIEFLYDLFNSNFQIPSGVSNTNDSPGLWPDTGLNVYMILPEYNLAENLCTSGILFNIGKGRYKYQFMVVQNDELKPIKNGKLYYRYAKPSSNVWSGWKRWLYSYELTGGKDENGNRYKDDFGKGLTDTEDMNPDDNPNNIYGILKTIKIHASYQADKLATPRKIKLTGFVDGEEYFDGSRDIQIDTTTKFGKDFVPINVQINAGYRTTNEYHLIATLPQSTSETYDYIMIVGHIGGWETNQGKAWFTCDMSNCTDFVANGLVVGTLGENTIVAYKTSTGKVNIYLKLHAWVDDIKLSVYGSDQVIKSDTIGAPDSTETLIWDLKNKNVRVADGVVYGYLKGTADKALDSDTSTNVKIQNNALGYIIYPTGINKGDISKTHPDLLYNANVYIDASGTLHAKNIEANVTGNITSSNMSDKSHLVEVINNNGKIHPLGVLPSETVWSKPNFNTTFYYMGSYFKSDTGNIECVNITSNGTLKVNNLLDFADGKGITLKEHNFLHCENCDDVKFRKITMTSVGTAPEIDMGYKGMIRFTSSQGAHNSVILGYGENTYTYPDNLRSDLACLPITGSLKPNRVYNAVYNDFAELFPCDVEKVKCVPGDVLMLDISSDKETYIKSIENAKCVAGVVSDTYGYLMGGDDTLPPEEQAKRFIPIGLAGRVNVNVIGHVQKGDKLVATDDGCARVYRQGIDDVSDIIGYLLESDDKVNKRRLKMKIRS